MLIALCTGATAEDNRPATQRQLPQGQTLNVEGVEYKCFTLDEYKDVAHLVVDYRWFWDHTLTLERENALLVSMSEVQTQRVEIWKEQVESLEGEREFLSDLFDAEHGLRLKLEAKDRALGWIPWAIVVLESVAIGAIGLYAGAK